MLCFRVYVSVAGQFVCGSEKFCVLECMCLLQGSLYVAVKNVVLQSVCICCKAVCAWQQKMLCYRVYVSVAGKFVCGSKKMLCYRVYVSVAGQSVCGSEKCCAIECMCLLQGSLCVAAKNAVS